MAILHARVKDGHLVVDEPTDLPEGTTVELVLLGDQEEDLSPEERAELDASLDRGIDQMQRGEGTPAEEALQRIRSL